MGRITWLQRERAKDAGRAVREVTRRAAHETHGADPLPQVTTFKSRESLTAGRVPENAGQSGETEHADDLA